MSVFLILISYIVPLSKKGLNILPTMSSNFKLNILKRVFFLYLFISVPINLFIRNVYLNKFAPNAVNHGDFLFYLNRDFFFTLERWNPNYGFSILIRTLGIENINQIKSIFLAKSITTIGIMLIILSIFNVLKYYKYSQKKIKEIIYLFTILIALNPYFSIAGFKLSTESFIYLAVGLIYAIALKIIFYKKVIINKMDLTIKNNQSEINKNLIIFFIFLIVCSIRNILLISILSFFILYFQKVDFRKIFDKQRIIKVMSKLNWMSFFLIILTIGIFLFDLYLFIGYIEPYLSSRGNIFDSNVNDNFFNIIKNLLLNLPIKIVHILGFRESATIHSNYFLAIHPNTGNIISNNIFLTNILPVIFYIPFNALGIFFICKSKLFRFMFAVILPCIIPTILGATHMRYLYPIVPAITLGWSLFLVNKNIFGVNKFLNLNFSSFWQRNKNTNV